jgi:hypothetical protein
MKGKKKTGLEKRLMAYTAAAVGALAMVPSAEAVVHYSGPKNLTVNPQNPVAVDLNNDSVTDFRFIGYGYQVSTPYSSGFGVVGIIPETSKGVGGTGVIGVPGAYFTYLSYPTRLATGYNIQSSKDKWSNAYAGLLAGGLKFTSNGKSYSYPFGNFNNAAGCIGVRFNTDNGMRYGWIRFQGTSPSSGIIKDWAYEDSGGPIEACVAPAVNVPTLNQWGIMVLIALLAGMSLKALKTDKSGQDT